MLLREKDISTRGVLNLRGIHLFHYPMSSCSQKTRIVLGIKGVEWVPHSVDLSKAEKNGQPFLGINPRGLVPVLVVDGNVHIESNDILHEIERLFPEPSLFPAEQIQEIDRLLEEEDDLHIDLRTLSFRFVYNRTQSTKPAAALERYRQHGTGTSDRKKRKEVEFYDRIARDGITDDAIAKSAAKFRTAYDKWDALLSNQPYLLGDDLSVIDVAWYVYTHRLRLAGYPVSTLHPGVEAWFLRLHALPTFPAGLAIPREIWPLVEQHRRAQEEAGQTLPELAGWR